MVNESEPSFEVALRASFGNVVEIKETWFNGSIGVIKS
jgi:hypothetical protein